MIRKHLEIALGTALLLVVSGAALGQLPDAPPLGSTAAGTPYGAEMFGEITVYLRAEDGSPIPARTASMLTMTTPSSTLPMRNTALLAGDSWVFTGVGVGNDYVVHVSVPGYQPAHESVSLPNKPGVRSSVIVFMTPVDQSLMFHPPTGNFVLAPKPQKEIQHALQDLQGNNIASGRKHAEKALELAPENPYVEYVMGLTYVFSKQWDQAKPYLEKSVSIDSRQPASLLALGTLRYEQKDYKGAIQVLNMAVQLDGTSWKADWYLACSYLEEKKYAEARDHAEQALKVGKGKAGAIDLVLAQAFAGLGERERAADVFEKFAKENPKDPNTERAMKWAEEMRRPPATGEKPGLETVAIPTATSAGPAVPAPPPVEIPPRADWAPPDVDAVKPFVISGAVCPLAKVLEAAGKNAEELVANLQEFSATEEYQAIEIKRDGQLERPAARAFNYMVFIDKASPESFQVQELRNEGISPADFPGRLADMGVPVLALAFHPMIQGDLDWTCEGLGKWNERPAWVVRFQQRRDRPSVLSTFITPSHEYTLDLKGRAWVSENGGQVLHLETDLVKELQPLDLKRQHFVIDYELVSFSSHNMDLWLPASVDAYIQYQGHFLHHYHHFKDFKLFWVGSTQKISRPKNAPPPDDTTAPQ
jgi:Tfp pilus assembly protein PilF